MHHDYDKFSGRRGLDCCLFMPNIWHVTNLLSSKSQFLRFSTQNCEIPVSYLTGNIISTLGNLEIPLWCLAGYSLSTSQQTSGIPVWCQEKYLFYLYGQVNPFFDLNPNHLELVSQQKYWFPSISWVDVIKDIHS